MSLRFNAVSPNWLARYRAGQRDLVWHELRQLGSAVRESGLVEEAQLLSSGSRVRILHGAPDQRLFGRSNTCCWEPNPGFGPTGRIRKKVSGKTKVEVRDKLRELHKELDVGLQPRRRYTVGDALEDWLERGTDGLSARTLTLYRGTIAKALHEELGGVRLTELAAADMQRALASLASRLSTRTVQIAHNRHGTGGNEEDQLQAHKPKIIARPPACGPAASRQPPRAGSDPTASTAHTSRWHAFSACTTGGEGWSADRGRGQARRVQGRRADGRARHRRRQRGGRARRTLRRCRSRPADRSCSGRAARQSASPHRDGRG
jgi:hypothetical protein